MHTTLARHPQRSVLRWATPDPRKPWFKDYVLACGHILVHRPLRRGPDGRLHVARRLVCPHCHGPELPRARPQEASQPWPAADQAARS